MANTITLHREAKNVSEWVGMSNGYTSVILSLIVLSGSVLATSEREKEIIVWIAQHDQSVVGIGTVGFSLDEIPWTVGNFKDEKKFFLTVIQRAIDKVDWEVLDYAPGDHTLVFLEQLFNLVNKFDIDHVNNEEYIEWKDLVSEDYGNPPNFKRCTKHNILLYWGGCIICNDK